jgi:aminoglycoside phosphotransferase (APT) family kinase protein
MRNRHQSYEQIIETIIIDHFGKSPKSIRHITIGVCNEVYSVCLPNNTEVIVRLSPYNKCLMGSRDHIPKLNALGIKVPDILAQDYSKTKVPISYQIQSKIEGQDLGHVIATLTHDQLTTLAQEIARIFNKIKTIPTDGTFGIIWGGGENEVSDSWTKRMRIWIDESENQGKKTGVIDDSIAALAENIFTRYKPYFDAVKPITYFGDISSKNVMIHKGAFSGLVDLDGLTQGDPLEAIGRIKLSWYGSSYGEFYTNALMDAMHLSQEQRTLVTMYALLNQISWTCENGIQFNQNTQPIVNREKEQHDKLVIKELAAELGLG